MPAQYHLPRLSGAPTPGGCPAAILAQPTSAHDVGGETFGISTYRMHQIITLHRNKYRILRGKLRTGETYKGRENNFDPSRLYPPPYPNTAWQFTSKCKVLNIRQFAVMKKKVRSKALYTVPFLVLFKTQKRLKQQPSPFELKPTGAEAAPGQCSFQECE